MPISVAGLRELPSGQPTTVISPLVELGSALHVLTDPTHHRRESWAESVRSDLSPGLRRRTAAWAWTTQAIRAAPFLTTSTDGFDADLERLRATPPRQLATRLLRSISRAGDLAAARRWSRSRGPAVIACVELLIDRPADGVADFVDFLTETWTAWFGRQWQNLEPDLRAGANRFGRRVGTTGRVAAALAELDGSVTTTAGGGVVIAKVQNARHDVSRRGLAVALSAFVWPHLYVGNVPGQPLHLICPLEPTTAPGGTVSEVMTRAAVLAHPGRLEVARAIATEPRTAGEIAALWQMDPTLVNRHLRSLAAAGVATPTRRGRFVQYGLDLDAVHGIGEELAYLLLR